MIHIDRPELTADDINQVILKLQKEVARRLNEKGKGSFVSRHEIFGAVNEEFKEMEDAVRSETLGNVSDELLHTAAAAIIGIAGIDANKVEY